MRQAPFPALTLGVLDYFDEQTMSVHLRARCRPRAKRGTPGKMELVYLQEAPLADEEVDRLADEILAVAGHHPDGFLEVQGKGADVVQLANLRIAITRPPFADATEITVVRPVARTRLADYDHEAILRQRFGERHRGVLVAGAPGAGKSTFVQAVADALEEAGWMIKTMERPRDLDVSDEITQYTALDGDFAKTADVLLLVRPDYTIFDEMRRTDDFLVFADLRLAGTGMIGVVHATRAIDGLQRMVGRIELGMIAQIVDTVVYIDGGQVKDVYELELTVKMPSGLGDEGLARPVIEVRDAKDQKLLYEMYSFADQVVVMPIGKGQATKAVWRLAERALEQDLRHLIKGRVAVEIRGDTQARLFVESEVMSAVVGRGGSNVRELEDTFGLRFDVRSFDEYESQRHSTAAWDEDGAGRGKRGQPGRGGPGAPGGHGKRRGR